MPRRPTDEQTQQTGDFTETQPIDTTQQSGTFSAELEQEPTGDEAVNNPNIINR